jgi:hypothetical protein
MKSQCKSGKRLAKLAYLWKMLAILDGIRDWCPLIAFCATLFGGKVTGFKMP